MYMTCSVSEIVEGESAYIYKNMHRLEAIAEMFLLPVSRLFYFVMLDRKLQRGGCYDSLLRLWLYQQFFFFFLVTSETQCNHYSMHLDRKLFG